ncbi:hypothetical protein CRG98_028400 [Punica granatum]|uniref:inorganic diphosphatase n=1 Tax=Punica granatum TaxID=22663 RepID=A0A2I0J568_PUNGR|nr:hypothetical protein CRG98_028400 [Punica granatum]
MEVAINEPFTWIKQDTKKMNLCYYLYNIHWNYGLLLQTWEDSSFANSDQARAAKIQERKKGKCKYIYLYVFGDSIYLMIFSCLVDVVEIGETGRDIGQILRVKPLASLAVIDEGELDWKTVTISSDDPRASIENDVDDVEKYFLGINLTAIRDWFRDCKIPDGKPANKFGLCNKPANKDYSLKVITETNESARQEILPSGELSFV